MQSPDAVLRDELLTLMPKLRVQALALTRNRTAADDLVQDTIANALKAMGSFTPGTNLSAWLHRILRNRFISDLRRRREMIEIGEAPPAYLAAGGAHEDRLVLKELHRALGRLQPDQREALFMVVLQGMAYEEVAAATGCALGTAKSRVFRARRQLEIWLTGEERMPAPPQGEQQPRRGSGTRLRPAAFANAPART